MAGAIGGSPGKPTCIPGWPRVFRRGIFGCTKRRWEGALPTYEDSWENEKRRYEEKLFSLCEGLRRRGSDVAVTLYNRGDLRTVLRNYRLSGRYWILMPCGVSLRLKTFLSRELSIFGLSKTSTYAPAFLLSTDLT